MGINDITEGRYFGEIFVTCFKQVSFPRNGLNGDLNGLKDWYLKFRNSADLTVIYPGTEFY